MADCMCTTFLLCFGDDDIVVTVVVAVLGLSIDDMAAADEVGSLPVSSSFLMRDFRSSSSSHTVDGAVVDIVDSVGGAALGAYRAFESDTYRCVLLAATPPSCPLRPEYLLCTPDVSGDRGRLSLDALLGAILGAFLDEAEKYRDLAEFGADESKGWADATVFCQPNEDRLLNA